ncbi:hypothetical protein ACFWXO_37865 [Kitasatospora sp. NPDC059088]|uniref:hypothetical protein n=1 Tax=Kitasatospora sp. NPDC059088 TaxID=3346722 RepID=UPI0036CF3392
MAAKQMTFDYPDDLRQAQRALVAARAERSGFLAGLPPWGGDLKAMLRGVGEEQYAESSRLVEAERQAALVVMEHPFWAQLPAGDRVAARTALMHVDETPPAATA